MVITELLEQLKQEKKFKGAYEVAKYLKDQADNIEDQTEARKLPFYIEIYQVMGEFLYYEGNQKDAIKHMLSAEAMILKYIP